MASDCAAARATAYALIGAPAAPPAQRPPAPDVDGALEHIMRCRACRGDLPPEDRGRFVHLAVLSRE